MRGKYVIDFANGIDALSTVTELFIKYFIFELLYYITKHKIL